MSLLEEARLSQAGLARPDGFAAGGRDRCTDVRPCQQSGEFIRGREPKVKDRETEVAPMTDVAADLSVVVPVVLVQATSSIPARRAVRSTQVAGSGVPLGRRPEFRGPPPAVRPSTLAERFIFGVPLEPHCTICSAFLQIFVSLSHVCPNPFSVFRIGCEALVVSLSVFCAQGFRVVGIGSHPVFACFAIARALRSTFFVGHLGLPSSRDLGGSYSPEGNACALRPNTFSVTGLRCDWGALCP